MIARASLFSGVLGLAVAVAVATAEGRPSSPSTGLPSSSALPNYFSLENRIGLRRADVSPLLYVEDGAGISVYDEHGRQVEDLKGWGGQPAVDRSGNLYLGSINHLAEFPPGAMQPSRVITLAAQFYLSAFALDKKGDIWATQFYTGPSGPSEGPGQLLEFDNNGNLLQTLQCTRLTLFGGVALDARGDAFVNGWFEGKSQQTAVVEWPSGSKSCRLLPAAPLVPSGMEISRSGDLLVEDASNMRVTTYAAPQFNDAVETTILKGISGAGVAVMALRKGDKEIWTPNDLLGTITRFRFPQGGQPTFTIRDPNDPVYLAVSPCAKPNC